VVENLPDPMVRGAGVVNQVYKMFHSFNVHGARFTKHKPSNPRFTGCLALLDFETTSEAQRACDNYDKTEMKGHQMRLSISKPPMKQLGGSGASWDGGRAGQHYSLRDTGSAKGTNFEMVCATFVDMSIGVPRDGNTLSVTTD